MLFRNPTRKFALLLLVAALSLSLAAAVFAENLASTPVSDGGVTPYLIAGENNGGNRTCAEVGLAFFNDAAYYEFSSERTNYTDGSFDAAFPAGLSVSTDGTFVSFSSTFGIGAVIVKGSNNANVYVYEPQVRSDSRLASPPNSSGGPAGLSNITFCWNPEPAPAQWCSPGYWRQPQHLGSWEATGYNMSDLYSAVFGAAPARNRQGVTNNAPVDPTLLEVLSYPQYYGGDAFNAVGDLLSDAHPDVNFTGERVEDSCPLGLAPADHD